MCLFITDPIGFPARLDQSILKKLVGASGFEPPTSWSRPMNTNSINPLSGVANGTRSLVRPFWLSVACPQPNHSEIEHLVDSRGMQNRNDCF